VRLEKEDWTLGQTVGRGVKPKDNRCGQSLGDFSGENHAKKGKGGIARVLHLRPPMLSEILEKKS